MMSKEREAEIRDHGVDHLECADVIEEIFRELDATRELVAKLVEIFRAQQKQAEVDTARALKLNDDAKYWAACGRQSAYRHAIELLKEQP